MRSDLPPDPGALPNPDFRPDARIVIVGGGHGGGAAAAALRQYGHRGPVALVGAEPLAPYHRPPLSKAFLKGEAAADALLLKPESFYAAHGIGLRLGARAAAIDRARRTVILEGGETLAYDALILATGSRNRALAVPGADAGGVHELRSLADAEGLRGALAPGARLLIVGGGYIGLEAAASARALGAEAVVVEREARVLARVASPHLSQFFELYHRARGVEVLTETSLVALETGPDGRVRAGVLADGRRVACDAALVGIGAAAEDSLARAAGLDCDDGVIVDAQARTSDPHIFAVGDMTRRPLPLYEGRMARLESAPGALEQARAAAAAIVGAPPPRPEPPWFWSDQYDLKLQIAGLPFEADETVLRGRPDTAKFSVFHLKAGRVRAVEAVNAPGDFMAGKSLILSGVPVSADALADESAPLRPSRPARAG